MLILLFIGTVVWRSLCRDPDEELPCQHHHSRRAHAEAHEPHDRAQGKGLHRLHLLTRWSHPLPHLCHLWCHQSLPHQLCFHTFCRAPSYADIQPSLLSLFKQNPLSTNKKKKKKKLRALTFWPSTHLLSTPTSIREVLHRRATPCCSSRGLPRHHS